MTDLSTDQPPAVIIGVDTHKDVHVAVAIDPLGRKVDQHASATTPDGISDLLAWATTLAPSCDWGIEGTSSYGAGLTRRLHAEGAIVHEVCRPGRRVRRTRGKSDPIDAEVAARAVLAGDGLIEAKSSTTMSESLRNYARPADQQSRPAPRPPTSSMRCC